MENSTFKKLIKEKELPKSAFYFLFICTVGVIANPSLPVSSDRQDPDGSAGQPDPGTPCAPLSSLLLLGLTSCWGLLEHRRHQITKILQLFGIYFTFISCVCLAVLLDLFWSWIKHIQSGHGCVKASRYENGSSNLVNQIFLFWRRAL